MFVHVGDSNSTTENLSYFFCKLATIKGRGDDVNYGLRWIEYCNKAVKIKMVVLMPMNMEQQVCVALLSQGPHTFITETSWDCSTTAFIAIHCNFCFCSSRRREHFWETDIEDDEEKHPPICEKWGLNVEKNLFVSTSWELFSYLISGWSSTFLPKSETCTCQTWHTSRY